MCSSQQALKNICPVFMKLGSNPVRQHLRTEFSIPQSKAWFWEAISEQCLTCSTHPCSWPLPAHHDVVIPGTQNPLCLRGTGDGGSFCKSAFGRKSFWRKSLLGWLLSLRLSCCTPWNRVQTVQAASASAFGSLQRASCSGWDRFLFSPGLACQNVDCGQ